MYISHGPIRNCEKWLGHIYFDFLEMRRKSYGSRFVYLGFVLLFNVSFIFSCGYICGPPGRALFLDITFFICLCKSNDGIGDIIVHLTNSNPHKAHKM